MDLDNKIKQTFYPVNYSRYVDDIVFLIKTDISEKYKKISIIANSIGAYFSLISLTVMPIEKAMLISPIVDMERIILDMMKFENVTEDELKLKKRN